MSTKKYGEAGELVIRNIGILEQASAIAYDIDCDICVQVETFFQDMLNEQKWFKKLPSAKKKKYIEKGSWVALNKWHIGEGKEDEYYARFIIFEQDAEDSEDGNEYYITKLCNQRSSRIGISLRTNYQSIFQRNGKKSWATMWNEYSSNQNKLHPQLEVLGFVYNEGTWFLPMEIDIDELATATRDGTFDDVLRRMVEKCVDIIEQAAVEFDAIIQNARIG